MAMFYLHPKSLKYFTIKVTLYYLAIAIKKMENKMACYSTEANIPVPQMNILIAHRT